MMNQTDTNTNDVNHRQNKRRSSILQHAKRDITSMNLGAEILRGLPQSLQQNVVRLSSGAGRVSVGQRSYPTPLGLRNACVNASSNSAQKSSIPRSTVVKKSFMNQTAVSSAKSKTVFGGDGTGSSKKVASKQTTTMPKSATNVQAHSARNPKPPGTVNIGKGKRMRRHSSMDNLSALGCSAISMTPSSTFCTPGPVHHGQFKTPGSVKRWGSANNLTLTSVVRVKVPTNKDQEILFGLTHSVYSYFENNSMSNLLPAGMGKFKGISTSNFLNLITIVGQRLVGARFFQTKGKEDPTIKIVELANILKYPSALSKSHLKSATAPNSWPSSLTFLAWLCCRAEAAYVIEEEKPVNDFLNNFPQIAMENYLAIYYADLASRGDIQAVVEEELMKFRAKVLAELMGESNSTIEELRAIKEEKDQELRELLAKPDPTKEVLELLEINQKKLTEVAEKIKITIEQINHYQDVKLLESQAEALKIEVQSKVSAVKKLEVDIKSQPIDQATASKMINEIEEYRKQRICLSTMHDKLRKELELKHQHLQELDGKFRQVVAQFTVVETFNSKVANLKLEGSTLPLNPFASEELDEWLDMVSKIQDKTEKAIHTWLQVVKNDLQKVREASVRADEELVNARRQLQTKKVHTSAAMKFHEGEERRKSKEISVMENQLQSINFCLQSTEDEIENIRKQMEEKHQALNQAKQAYEEISKSKEELELYLEFAYAEYQSVRTTLFSVTTEKVIALIASVKEIEAANRAAFEDMLAKASPAVKREYLKLKAEDDIKKSASVKANNTED